MSDFVRKSVQKKILDFHDIGIVVKHCSEKNQEFDKAKKEKNFSIGNFHIGEGGAVRPSKSYLNLPPITPGAIQKCKSSDSLKVKEESLKKLDIIVDSCKELLADGKRRENKTKTFPGYPGECKSR